MTSKTPTVIALGLLLATALAMPTDAAEIVNKECANEAKASLGRDVQVAALRDLAATCQPDTEDPCPPGTVGAAGRCFETDPGELPSLGACPSGSVGYVVDGRPVCISGSLPETPIEECPDGSVGVRVAGKLFCAQVEDVQLPPSPFETCPDGSTGVRVVSTRKCLGPVDVPEIPDVPKLPGESQESADTCDDYDNEEGMGGTNVHCNYDCLPNEALGITVKSHDTEYVKPDVSGYTACGGANAECPRTKSSCVGASIGVTKTKQNTADCRGRSHETFDSGVTVACVSVGACTVLADLPILCNDDLRTSNALAYCMQTSPVLAAHADQVAVLLGTLPESGLSSFVVFELAGDRGFSVRYTGPRHGNESCSGGPFALG